VKKRLKGTRVKDRADQMVAMREKGHTFERIAEEFGLTRQRVHQLVTHGQPLRKIGRKAKPMKPEATEPDEALLRGRGVAEKVRQFKVAHKSATTAEIGDRIVYARMKHGWTLGHLSSESGVPYGVLSTYENNRSQPSCDSLRKLCLALQCSAHWLLFGRMFRRLEG
jgi:hypothetical protein